jgi:UDP-GlcNAc3NAcA epimerase
VKVVSVVGARPQLIKAAAVSRALRLHHTEILVHTGQHYDREMSDVFFEELDIPKPDLNLGVGSAPHGAQTGAMLAGVERALLDTVPDWVLVYGDTNSTVAAALAAAKLHIPVAHVEAGLRSFNRAMPEEINRVVTDHLADLLLCPSDTAVRNLAHEGIRDGVYCVGDVMLDALLSASTRAKSGSDVLRRFAMEERQYIVATIHRAENTDDPERLRSILRGLAASEMRVVFPVHPRTRRLLAGVADTVGGRVSFIEPLGYLDMVRLVAGARLIATDSGGLQKEAYWLGVPCITLRDETEWVETVATGWNRVVGADTSRIVDALRSHEAPPRDRPPVYGAEGAAVRCVELIEQARRPRKPSLESYGSQVVL